MSAGQLIAEMRLAVLRLHQRDAALDARERLARVVEAAPPGPWLALLTCHRVEVYGAVPLEADPRAALAAALGADAHDEALAGAAVLRDEAAATHLLRVAAGLDSALKGEGQILGQIRRAYDAARAERRLPPVIGDLFRTALRVGRELRATTPLGAARRSIGSLAVDEVVRLLPDPASATILVVGAGEVGKLATRSLGRRVARVVVANRSLARAEALAAELTAEAVGLDALAERLADSDAVISAADSRGEVLTAALLAGRLAARPLVLVDVAVPRSVGPEARTLPGLIYRSVDDLAAPEDVLAETLAEAEARCLTEAAEVIGRDRGRGAGDTIRALRERADEVRRRQVERALRRLGHLGERDRRVVEALAEGVANALLHEPTVALRQDPARADSARALFRLER